MTHEHTESASSTPESHVTDAPIGETTKTFRILSLDGGGLKGMLAAAVLSELERDLGVSLINHFDLIAGTSTGGIVALGLGAGFTPDEILSFYVEHGTSVFGSPRRGFRRLTRPKHKTDALRSLLTEFFGDKRLGDSKTRLVIPSYSLDRNDVYIFKTPHHQDLTRDWRESMVDVALATTAAPTYFSPLPLRHNRLIDGGVWANNPAIVAVAEATGVLGVPLDSIRVLSIGTSYQLRSMSNRLNSGGLIAWVRHGRTIALEAPAKGSFHTVKYLVGRDHAVRIDPIVEPHLFRLDRVDEHRIRGLAEEVARHETPDVRAFVDSPIEPYIPLRP